MSFVWGSLFSDHQKPQVTSKPQNIPFFAKNEKLLNSRQLWGRVPESKRRRGRVWAVVVAGGHSDDGDEDEDNLFFIWHNIMIK